MNFRTGGGELQVSGGSHLLVHTVGCPARGRGKRPARQLAQSPCQRATQVVLGVPMTTRKSWSAATQQIRDRSYGCSLSQPFFGDPLVGNTPIRRGESLWNPQPLQPSLINVESFRGGTGGGEHRLAGEWRGSGSGDGAGDAPHLSLCGLYQRSALGRQADLGVPESHPGSISIALAPEGFLVGDPGQPSQRTPVGAGLVGAVGVGQLSGDGGRGRLQADRADLNPSLEMTGAGLEHHTGWMRVDSHPCERPHPCGPGCSRSFGLQHRAEGIRHGPHDCARAGIVPSTPDPNWVAVQSRSPREGPSGGVVNQLNQIEIMRHRRELASDGAQREEQASIEHKHSRRSNSPYDTLMLYPRGRRRKSIAGNGRCQNSGFSQKGRSANP
jgi:hypothetical protein